MRGIRLHGRWQLRTRRVTEPIDLSSGLPNFEGPRSLERVLRAHAHAHTQRIFLAMGAVQVANFPARVAPETGGIQGHLRARLPGYSLPWGDEADGPLRPRLNHSSGLELWLELWPLTCHLAPHTSLIQLLALILGPSRHLLRGCHAQMQFPPVDPHPGAPRHTNRGQLIPSELIPFMQGCTDFSCGTGMLFSCSTSLHI